MKNLKFNKRHKYFVYALLCVSVFVVIYAMGWFINLDINWFVNGWENTPVKRADLLHLILITLGIGIVITSLIDFE